MAQLPPISQVVGPHSFAYEALFKQADSRGKSIVSAAQAAIFLKHSGLKESVLSQIWDLSDPVGKGHLDKQGFFVALKLIALVQNGKEANMANIALPVPLPNMGGASSVIDSSADKIPWSISTEEQTKYGQVFETLRPVDGKLPGDKVRPVLLNSKLPVDILGRIWDLSDIDGDGSLDRDEFIVALHLVCRAREKEPLPTMLPIETVPPSKRKTEATAAAKAASPPTVTSPPPGSTPATSGIRKWVVNDADKARYDEMFVKADTDKDGYVNGTEIKGIFLKSGLQQQVLARIWSLCDTRNMGKLTRDQFALAIYLIQQKLKGVDPPGRLPPEMIPPSVRRNSLVDGVIPTGLVVDYSTPGMKELDALGAEIDKLRRDRMRMEQEKAQKEADMKTRGTEITTLQKELEVLAAAAKKLETQKVDAQKRLDDLDKKKSKLEVTLQESENRCAAELKQVEELQTELTANENSDKSDDVELRAKREELQALRQEELALEVKVESGHDRLVQLMKFVRAVQADLEQAEYVVGRMQETAQSLNRTSDQFDSLSRGELSVDDATRRGLFVESWPPNFDTDVFENESILSRPGFIRSADGSLLYEMAEDLSGTAAADAMDDSGDNIPPGADPFSEALELAAKQPEPAPPASKQAPARPPPLGEDPWSYSRLITKAQNDPFAVSDVSTAKSPVNPEDPFGTGSFGSFADDAKGLQPAGNKPPRPKSPGPSRPKSPAPPGGRPKSPAPPGRPKSPAPGGRAKSPSGTGSKPKPGGPPPRPAAPPCKSPSGFKGDNGAAASGTLRNGSSSNILSPGAADPSYSDFSAGHYSTDEPTSWD